jgi:restriction endonuclease S subunit
LHRLRPISDAVDPQYLVHRLWLSALRGEFTSDHAQTTIAHLPAIRLAELQIGTPPIAIQRQIVTELGEHLSAIDAMTVAIGAELRAIDALPAAFLRRAFDDLVA